MNAVFKSTDGGGTWSPADSGYPGTEMRALGLSSGYPDDQTLYGGFAPVYISSNAGVSWSPLGPTSWHRYLNALAVTPGAKKTVFAGTDGQGLWCWELPYGKIFLPLIMR